MIRHLFPFLLAGLLAGAEPLPLPKETPWDLASLKKEPEFKWQSQHGREPWA